MSDQIQLRDGGRYKMRNGEITSIEKAKYPWVDEDGNSYMDNGRFSEHEEKEYDIVAEVTDEKEEKNNVQKYEVGKFYKSDTGNKFECTAANDTLAFMRPCTEITFKQMDGLPMIGKNLEVYQVAITGPWVEPLAIKWEMIAPTYDRLAIHEDGCQAYNSNKGNQQLFSFASSDHIATGWRDHIGETHYRDGDVEKAK